jgi:hypothetical protein
VPGDTLVTNPDEEPIVATEVVALVQVPPVIRSLRLPALPIHTS